MKFLKYVVAFIVALLPSIASAEIGGQIIIREYYRNYNVQPYVIEFTTRHVEAVESCRTMVSSIMDAYYIEDIYTLKNLNFLITRYVCLNTWGKLVDSGYYYVVPKNTITGQYCVLTWNRPMQRFDADEECVQRAVYVPIRFDKPIPKSNDER